MKNTSLVMLLFFLITVAVPAPANAADATASPTFGSILTCPGNTACPSPSPSPSITNGQSNPTSGIVTPSSSSIPTTNPQQPCEAAASLAHSKKTSKHKKHDGQISKFMQTLIKFFIELLNTLIKLLGGQQIEIPNNADPIDEMPESTPCPEPSTVEQPTVEPSIVQPSTLAPISSTLAPTSIAVSPSIETAAKRYIPIAPNGGLGQYNLSSKSYIMAFRFVLDQPTTIDRWYFAINGEGASCIGGRTGYGSGNGGIEFGRIVEVNQATGLPTTTVLAQESVNGCTAHTRTITEFGLSKTHQAHFIQFAPVALQANKMYAFLLSNTDPNPGSGGSAASGNHMSPNLNFTNVANMGPNGKNTLDAQATGAMYGYDPRETTMWSKDSGSSWLFGSQVGWYGNSEGKMWVVGYRSGGKNIPHGYTYMTWPGEKSGLSITYKNSPKAVTLTQAGGAGSSSVGVVTVTNNTTGVSATTEALGGGVAVGTLSKPIPVAVGESYTIKASGTVEQGSSSFWDKIFGLGGTYSCSGCSSATDMPSLFALPHPYY